MRAAPAAACPGRADAEKFSALSTVDEQTVRFSGLGRQRAPNGPISQPVDSCGHVDKLCAIAAA
jgi:hypothetical protein